MIDRVITGSREGPHHNQIPTNQFATHQIALRPGVAMRDGRTSRRPDRQGPDRSTAVGAL